MTNVMVVAPSKAPLTGIGGWLFWMAIGQILAPIRVIYDLVKYYADKDMVTTFRSFPVAMSGELILNLLCLAFIFYISTTFFQEKRVFKKAFTVGVFAVPMVTFFDFLWVCTSTGVPFATLIGQHDTLEMIGKDIGALVISLPWTAYVWRSRRVRNTFVN